MPSPSLTSRHHASWTHLATSVALALLGNSAHAQSLSLDLNVAVSRVGNGSTPLSAAPTAVFVDNYKVSVSVDTSSGLPLPTFTTAPAVTMATGLWASGTDSAQGVLNISGDRRSLLMGGAAASSGSGPTLASWSASGLSDSRLNPNQATVDLSSTASGVRGTWSPDSHNFYAATTGTAGVQAGSFASGNTPVSLLASGQNGDARQLGGMPVYTVGSGGLGTPNLVYSAGSGTGGVAGIYQLGSGLPETSGQTSTLLAATRNGATPNGFIFVDLSTSVEGVDTLYVATEGDGLEKFTLGTDANGSFGWHFTDAIALKTYKQGLITFNDSFSANSLDGYGAPAMSVPDGQGGTIDLPAFAVMAMTGSHHKWLSSNGKTTSDTTTDELDVFMDFSGYGAPMGSGWMYTLAGGLDSGTLDLRGVAVTPDVALAVPEPQSMALWLAGLCAMAWRMQRRSRALTL